MIRKIDDTSTESRFQRAQVTGVTHVGSHAEANTIAGELSGRSHEGWDPWDVWLRRIEQPRRRRAELEASGG